jgi:hypothetical protein
MAILVLSKLSLVVSIECVLQSLYIFFFSQSKENARICDPCQDIGDQGLEIVTQHQNLV